jgi:hypothetical protein
MTYNDLAKAGFGFVCDLLLGVVLSLISDVLVSLIRPKLAGFSFPGPATQPTKVVTVDDLLAKANPADFSSWLSADRASA